MQQNPIIALLTDFGTGSHYVGQMKGVIHGIHSSARVVDVSHAVAPQDIYQAAWVLRDSQDAFPPNTIFVTVVDPGVGSARAIVCLETTHGIFIGPDNGVFSLVADNLIHAYRLDNRKLWRPTVSATFHGRDVMAPVAARLAQGLPMADVGSRISEFQRLDFVAPVREAQQIVGQVEYVDAFGNLITNIPFSELGDPDWIVEFASDTGDPIGVGMQDCYAAANAGEVLALVGSHGRLEIAVACGNAAALLKLGRQSPVYVRRRE